MKVRLARGLQTGSIVDGEGLRAVVWAQGCSHNCTGCHNKQTHDFGGGFEVDVDDINEQISSLKLHSGITLSGGDPLFQPMQFAQIACHAKKVGLSVWCYTGFTFEQLLQLVKTNEHIYRLLQHIDVLVDGKFILEQRTLNLKYRGSKNQRVIDVQESLKENKIVIRQGYQIDEQTQTYVPIEQRQANCYNEGLFI